MPVYVCLCLCVCMFVCLFVVCVVFILRFACFEFELRLEEVVKR